MNELPGVINVLCFLQSYVCLNEFSALELIEESLSSVGGFPVVLSVWGINQNYMDLCMENITDV